MLKVHYKETGQMFGQTKEHLKEVKMTYWQHLGFALGLIPFFLFAAVFSFIHAILPGLFSDTVSSIVREINFKLFDSGDDYTLNQDDKC